MAKFKVGDAVVDPVSGRDGTIIKVEEPQFAYMGTQYLVILSNGINYEQIRDRKPRKDDEGESSQKLSLVEFLRDNKIRQSVVICDESHRLRNESTQSYRGAATLLEQSNAVIFLTATPVMIKEENLYNQMHLLCSEKYSHPIMW